MDTLHYNISPKVEAFSINVPDSHCPGFDVVTPSHQVHGSEVAVIQDKDMPHPRVGEVDAIITNVAGLLVGVKTADCVPILLFDGATGSVGAVHSGWRGTLANICAKAVEKMQQAFGSQPSDIEALIGPCIHVEAYEVGDELIQAFAREGYGPEFYRKMPAYGQSDSTQSWHLDLAAICRHQLLRAGLRSVTVRPECTFALYPRFYSARRLGSSFAQQRIFNCIRLLS